MESLEAMTKGSDQRYLGNTAKLEIVQGVVRASAHDLLKWNRYQTEKYFALFSNLKLDKRLNM
ncbi:unnamed protein product [Malus baccata var. baccata]